LPLSLLPDGLDRLTIAHRDDKFKIASMRHLMIRFLPGLFPLFLIVVLLGHVTGAEKAVARAIDPQATPETVALFQRLRAQSSKGVLFGHQDTSAYGVGWRGDKNRSDIKDVCGDWPVVYGWDLGDSHKSVNLDGVRFEVMTRLIIEADARGGINTLSLHLENSVTGGNAWDKRPAVENILPGGSNHATFLKTLDQVATFLGTLKRKDGKLIPVVLRPFHEHNQDWSWWGTKACTEKEFVAL